MVSVCSSVRFVKGSNSRAHDKDINEEDVRGRSRSLLDEARDRLRQQVAARPRDTHPPLSAARAIGESFRFPVWRNQSREMSPRSLA